MDTFSNRLREERIRLKLTQAALAKLGGIQPNTQRHYESDARSPNVDYLLAVAEILDSSYLITGQRALKDSALISPREQQPPSMLRTLQPDDLQGISHILEKLGGAGRIMTSMTAEIYETEIAKVSICECGNISGLRIQMNGTIPNHQLRWFAVIAEWQGMLPISGEIVIVEDDPVLRPLMAHILGDVRAKCVAFSSADDALMHVLGSHCNCGLLIADHGVPGQIQGTELARMFRAKWPKTPVIITSGYELDVATLPSDVAYLQKPWTIDSLMKTIADLVQPGIIVSRIRHPAHGSDQI